MPIAEPTISVIAMVSFRSVIWIDSPVLLKNAQATGIATGTAIPTCIATGV